MKIHEYYNQEVRPGDVGIEVEVEYKSGYPIIYEPKGAWIAKEDASIGYGIEYITRSPLKVGPTLYPKIAHLTEQIDPKTVVLDSKKAGVHVHVNVQEYTALQVWNAILAYWLIENPLVLYCGQHRMHNHFCLRVSKSPAILGTCYSSLTDTNSCPFSHFQQDNSKYGSLNIALVQKLNTLEFRAMRATIDPHMITSWAEAMHHLVKQASTFDSPEHLFDTYLASKKDTFLYRLLPTAFVGKLMSLPNYEGLAQENKKLLAPLAYFHNDWNVWHKNLIQAAIAKREDKAKQPKQLISDLVYGGTGAMVNATNPASWVSTQYINVTSTQDDF